MRSSISALVGASELSDMIDERGGIIGGAIPMLGHGISVSVISEISPDAFDGGVASNHLRVPNHLTAGCHER